MRRIHPTAVIEKGAELGESVEIGAYSVVGPRVRIGSGSRLASHVVVDGRTTLGERTIVASFAVLGGAPQLKKGLHAIEGAALVVGDDNVFREHVTVNVSSGEAPTTIGAKNLFMAASHVAHDVVIGSHCVFANAVQIAGHVVVEDWVTFGGAAAVAQWLRVGQSAFVAGGAMCERDVPPFVIVQGDRARVRALNVVGLERRALSAASIRALRRAFAKVFVRREASLAKVLVELDQSDPWVRAFVQGLASGPGRT